MKQIIYPGEGNKVISFTGKEIAIDDVREKYLIDKKEYQKTGVWPEIEFTYRDDRWEYYYYLQLMDNSLDLTKYLDFDYDTNKFKRIDLINLINEYGFGILFALYIYTNIKTDLSIGEWFMKYKDNLCLSTVINTDGEKTLIK